MSELSTAIRSAGQGLLKAAEILASRENEQGSVDIAPDPNSLPDSLPGEVEPDLTPDLFESSLPSFKLVLDIRTMRSQAPEDRDRIIKEIDKATHVRLAGEDHLTLASVMDGLRFMTVQQEFVRRNHKVFVLASDAVYGYYGDKFSVWCHWSPKGSSKGPRWMQLDQVINPGTESAGLQGRKVDGPFKTPAEGTKVQSVTFSELLRNPSQGD